MNRLTKMTTKEIIIASTIHLIIPLTGLFRFIRLKRQMEREDIQARPTIELFIIFVTYGGVILVLLTGLFWYWSGMASLGTFYLIFGAPIAMGIIAYRHRHTRKISKYHKWTYILGLAYFFVLLALFLISFLLKD